MLFMTSKLASGGNGSCPFSLKDYQLVDTFFSGNLAQIQDSEWIYTGLAHVYGVRIFLVVIPTLAGTEQQPNQPDLPLSSSAALWWHS